MDAGTIAILILAAGTAAILIFGVFKLSES